MGLLSILPEHLSFYELWIARLFVRRGQLLHAEATNITCAQLFLGLITVGPWILLIGYDLVYYCWRTVTHNMPIFGGRARGRQRPRMASRSFSLSGPADHALDQSLASKHGNQDRNEKTNIDE